MPIKILQQGHFDGFCLLYSILNSYKTFLCQGMSAEKFALNYANKWQQIIDITPSLQHFASGFGSNYCDKNKKVALDIEKSYLENCFRVLGGSKNKFEVNNIPIERVSDVNFSCSMIIFATTEKSKCEKHSGLDHWMCCVDHDQESYLLACSCTMLSCDEDYMVVERQSDSLSRYYNNKISKKRFNKTNVFEESIYQVSLIRPVA